MTFKDLRKRVRLEATTEKRQSKLFERLQNKPFWIWNVEDHKQEDVSANGDCCFNHIIGLPTKGNMEKPLFDYERLLYDPLISLVCRI